MKKPKHRAGFVTILGRPNAGKSTLLNALLGTKLAIVAAKPQTTRTSIQGVLTLPQAQIVFVDTPGIHRSNTLLNKRMIEKYRALHDFAAYIPISAKTGDGLDVLQQEIIQRLPSGPAQYPDDYLTDQPQRFLAAEVLREKVLHHTQQEVPHAVAVLIDSWEDTPKLLRIAATIYVERPGQKAILIGAGGAALKKIGTLARKELEHLFDRKVFLQTFVKVRAGWRQDPEFLTAVDWR
jgi:GTP-binding protein Era